MATGLVVVLLRPGPLLSGDYPRTSHVSCGPPELAPNHLPETVRRRMMLGMVAVEDLSDAERRVWDAFPTGRRVKQ